jgi:hypothetical protein
LKLLRSDRGVRLGSQFRDRLTRVAIVMHYLRYSESPLKQVIAAEKRTLPDLGVAGRSQTQRLNQLGEKQRYAVITLCAGWGGWPSGHDLRLASSGDFVVIDVDEFVQHCYIQSRDRMPRRASPAFLLTASDAAGIP